MQELTQHWKTLMARFLLIISLKTTYAFLPSMSFLFLYPQLLQPGKNLVITKWSYKCRIYIWSCVIEDFCARKADSVNLLRNFVQFFLSFQKGLVYCECKSGDKHATKHLIYTRIVSQIWFVNHLNSLTNCSSNNFHPNLINQVSYETLDQLKLMRIGNCWKTVLLK